MTRDEAIARVWKINVDEQHWLVDALIALEVLKVDGPIFVPLLDEVFERAETFRTEQAQASSTCTHEHYEMDCAAADGMCPICLSAKVKRLRAAAERVCWFDWSTDNDPDAVKAIDDLRAAITPCQHSEAKS